MYKLKMKKDDFINNVSEGYNISIDNDIIFYSKKNYDNSVVIKDYKKEVLRILFIKRFYILGLLLSSIFIFINSKTVNNIIFNGQYLINDRIEEKINENINKFGPFSFINVNLKNLSKEIRCMFPDYEWIDLKKKGNDLYVNINKSVINDINEDDLVIGDIVAKRDGVIKRYLVINGKMMVKENNYVKMGDVLISSNRGNDLTEAKGYVLAQTYEYKTFSIKKEDKNIKTTDIKNIKKLNICGFKIKFGKNKFDNYTENKKTIFNLFNIISLENIQYHKKSDIINIYNKSSALSYSKSLIVDEFNKSKTNELEEILEIINIDITDDNDFYYITYFVKYLESIGEFKRR